MWIGNVRTGLVERIHRPRIYQVGAFHGGYDLVGSIGNDRLDRAVTGIASSFLISVLTLTFA